MISIKKKNRVMSLYIKMMILIFFFCYSNIVSSQKKYESYNWLYHSNGKLIADTNYSIDDRISECVSSEAELTWYLANVIHVLNVLNPRFDMIEMGYAPSFILRIDYVVNEDSSNYFIDSVFLVDHGSLDSSLFAYFKELFNDFKFSQPCVKSNYFIHIPIKFVINMVTKKEDIGIEKVMEEGWFVVKVKYFPVINN